MLKITLLSFSLFIYSFFAFSQTCDPNDLYDQIISDYHSTIARRQDGSLVVWGEGKASDGVGHVLTPQQINSTNYPGLTGTPLKGALASHNLNESQAILLTTTGLFVWGKPGVAIRQVSTSQFQKITIAGKSDGLPPNVLPGHVKIMTATFRSLAIVTDSGHVWVLGSIRELYGDGSTAISNSWHRVKTSANTFPVLSGVVQLRMSVNAIFAVDSSNNWYTWGLNVYSGASTATSYIRATIMAKPADFPNELPKMIGVSASLEIALFSDPRKVTAYFVLSQSGNLYSVGDGNNGILGIGSTSNKTIWERVKKNSSENLNDVQLISLQEHDDSFVSACAITKDNNLYYWGANDYSAKPGNRPVDEYSTYPVIPDGFIIGVDKANYAEKGGHTLVYVKDASDRYCYVGHRINGSMGDGTATDTYELTMNCTNTAAVPLCSLCPATVNNKLTQTQTVTCAGSDVHELIGASSTLSNNNGVFYQWQSSVISRDGGFTNISAATTKNYIPKPLTQTTWYRRITSNTSPNCPFDISNVLRISVNPIPLKPLVMTSSTVCAGDPINLLSSAAAGVQYNWEGPDNFVSQLSAPVIDDAAAANAGTYKLSVRDANSCVSDTASTDVAVYTIDLHISTPNTVCEGLSIALEVSNPQPDWNYLWTGPNGFISDQKAPLITNANANKMGTYSLKVTDPTCQVSESVVISLENCENTLSISEGFSPNGDGVNDVWVIRGLSLYPNNSIVIFNRWGEKVYSSAPYNNDWNGRCTAGLVAVGNGELVPEGTYFYLFDKNNGDAPVKGSIYIKH